MARPIRVAVHDEHEIFRCGLHASLASDPGLEVQAPADPGAAPYEVDVAVVSQDIARRCSFRCPLVLCAADDAGPWLLGEGNLVAGVLRRSTLTEAQLHAAVRAAAAGLRINAEQWSAADSSGGFDVRARRVLELLADGRSTREIAQELSFSERTIKKNIHDLERQLRARSRAQVVAHAIRSGII